VGTPKIQPINDLNPLVYNADDIAAFERLDNLFHVHEDNWAVSQDVKLLNLIQSENGVSESQAMRYLLRLYRNLQREINNC